MVGVLVGTCVGDFVDGDDEGDKGDLLGENVGHAEG